MEIFWLVCLLFLLLLCNSSRQEDLAFTLTSVIVKSLFGKMGEKGRGVGVEITPAKLHLAVVSARAGL